MCALVEEMERKFLSKTAVTQGQAIRYFQDPFRLVPLTKFAEMVDKLTRNEIMSSNELRSELGMKPSDDPMADELRNSNMNHPDDGLLPSVADTGQEETTETEETNVGGVSEEPKTATADFLEMLRRNKQS